MASLLGMMVLVLDVIVLLLDAVSLLGRVSRLGMVLRPRE